MSVIPSYIVHGRFLDSLTCIYYANDPAKYNQNILSVFGEITKFKNSTVDLFGYSFKLETRKGRSYPIFLKAEEGIEIRATITHPSTNPSIELKICRPLIWSSQNPLEYMKKLGEEIKKTFCDGDIVIRRVDLNNHLSGYTFTHEDRKNFTGKFREKTMYYSTSSKRNDELTGYRFGTPQGKTIFGIIYNKDNERSETGSFDPSPFYSIPRNENAIWCIEFSWERARLKDYGIDTLDELEASLANLWKVATVEFLHLKESDSNDTKISRRETSDVWQLVQSSWGESNKRLILPEKEVQQFLIARNKIRLKQNLVGLSKRLGLATKEKLFMEVLQSINDETSKIEKND